MPLQEACANFVMADGTPMRVEGQTGIKLRWGERDFPLSMIVASLADYEGILGADFLKNTSCNFKENYMQIGGTKISLYRMGEKEGCAKIHVSEDTVVEPRGSGWVDVKMDEELVATKKMRRDGYCGIEGLDNLAEETGLVMGNQVIRLTGDRIRVNVLNVHDDPVSLRADTETGYAYVPCSSLNCGGIAGGMAWDY